MSGRERGQALVEAIVALPLCMVCALVLVDCGVLVRDRVAIAQAATRAAEAVLADDADLDAAAGGALPRTLRPSMVVHEGRNEITVRATSHLTVLGVVGAITQRSSVSLANSEVTT